MRAIQVKLPFPIQSNIVIARLVRAIHFLSQKGKWITHMRG